MACTVAGWTVGDRLGARLKIFGWPDPAVAEPCDDDCDWAKLRAARICAEVGLLWNGLCPVDGHRRRRNGDHRYAGVRRTGERLARDLSQLDYCRDGRP